MSASVEDRTTDAGQTIRVERNGPVPPQVPGSAVSVCSTIGRPAADGAVMFTGAPVVTTAEGLEVAVPEPATFEAVTITRSFLARSAVLAR